MAAIDVGAKVRLKSGGPVMTVQTMPGDYTSHCSCAWFDGTKLIRGNFAPEGLEVVADEKTEGS